MKYLKWVVLFVLGLLVLANLDSVEAMVRSILIMCAGILYVLYDISRMLQENHRTQMAALQNAANSAAPMASSLDEIDD